MKLVDARHFHPILAIAPGPKVAFYLYTGEAAVSGAVEHEHPVNLDAFGGRHFHSAGIGPEGRPLGYSTRTLEEVQPPQLTPSDHAKVRVWDDRLRS